MATKKTTTKTPSKAAPKAAASSAGTKPMSKSQLVQALQEANTELTRKQVKDLLESLSSIGHKQLKRLGVFTMPGFAKFSVVKKKAVKARKGVNPFTGEPTMFKAKPASKVVKARPIKAVKDAVS